MNKLLRTFMLTLLVLGLAVSGAMASTTIEAYTQMLVIDSGVEYTGDDGPASSSGYNYYQEKDLTHLIFSDYSNIGSAVLSNNSYEAKKLLVPANYNFAWEIPLPKIYAFYAMNNGGSGKWTQVPQGSYGITWTLSVDKSSGIIVNDPVYNRTTAPTKMYVTGAYPTLPNGEMKTVNVQLIGRAELNATGKENFDFTRLYSLFGNDGKAVYAMDLLVQGVAELIEHDNARFGNLVRIKNNEITVVDPDYETKYGVGVYKTKAATFTKPSDIVDMLGVSDSAMTVSYDVSTDITKAMDWGIYPSAKSFDSTIAKDVLSLDLTLISFDRVSVPDWLYVYSVDITTALKTTYSLDQSAKTLPDDANSIIWPDYDSGDIQMIVAYSKDIVDKVNAGTLGYKLKNSVKAGVKGRVVIPVKMHAQAVDDKTVSTDVYSLIVWDVVYGTDEGGDTPTPTPSTDELAISASTTSATGTVGTAISDITVTATAGTPTNWEYDIVDAAGTKVEADALGLTFTDSADKTAEIIAGTPKISGDFTITVYARDATTEKSVDITLKVAEAGSGSETGSFTIAANPATLTVKAGGTPVTATLSATSADGSVSYAASGADWGTVSAATFTAAPGASVAARNYTFTITGTDSATSKTATTTITVTVEEADNNGGEEAAKPVVTDENGNELGDSGLTPESFLNAMGNSSSRTVTLAAPSDVTSVQSWRASAASASGLEVDTITVSDASGKTVATVLLSVKVNESDTSANGGLTLEKVDATSAKLTIDPTKFESGTDYTVSTRYTYSDNGETVTSDPATVASFAGASSNGGMIYGGGSSGGCDAGFGALALAAVSLFLLKKRS